jgi:Sel1 repeat
MCNPLPIFGVLFLFVGALPTQENSDPRTTTGDTTQSDFPTLLSQAESGDREAQYRVAQLYAFPENRLVPKNDAASREWMLKSAEQGYAPAQARLGELELGATGDRGKAEMWLRRAAEQDNTEGQLRLGVTYENGKFGRKDYQEAFKWLLKAAEHGSPKPRSAWEKCTETESSFLRTTCWLPSGIERQQNIPQTREDQDRVAINWECSTRTV